MSDHEAIRVHGLNEFRRQLRELDRNLPKALRLAFNAAATNTVEAARKQVPRRTGRAAASLRAKSTQKYARASGGYEKRVPYYGWLDFGGTVRHKDGTHAVHRPFFKDGRYLYQAYFRRRDSGEFERDLQRELIKVALSAGLEVK
nr:hypothetical protein Hi04_10k_c361_00011 [uncultured bacterium]